MAAGGGFADLRTVGKPSTYNGDEELWNEWSFQVRAYLVMAGIITATDLSRCGNAKSEISMNAATEDDKLIANNLYYFLAIQTKAKAQMILRTIEVGNGYEAWRQLNQRYEKRDGTSAMGMLQCLLSYNLGHEIGQVLERPQEFNVFVSKYNSAVPIGDEMADTILVAITIRAVPEPLRTLAGEQRHVYHV